MNAKGWSEFQAAEYAKGGSRECTSRSLDTDRFAFARRVLLEERKPPGLVLDVGCGDGSFSRELAGKGYAMVGMDLPEAVDRVELRAGERAYTIDWERSHILMRTDKLTLREGFPGTEDVPVAGQVFFVGIDLNADWGFGGTEFDAVAALEIFEHVVYDFDLAEYVHRDLRPGGVLVVSVPLEDNNCLPGDHHLRYYTARSITKLLWAAGFDASRITTERGPSSLLVRAVK